jgi:uncharacterized membrane protein
MTKKRFIIILVILVVLAGAIGGAAVYVNQNAGSATQAQPAGGMTADEAGRSDIIVLR